MLSFNDGACGAVLPDTDYFILSPNVPYLRMPPLGSNREIYMRADYTYRMDDPLCWPQVSCPEYPHLTCIRGQPAEMSESDPFYTVFAPVSTHMFVICDRGSIVPHIGKLSNEQFSRLQMACTEIIKMAQRIERPATLVQEIHLYSDVLLLFLDHLRHLPMNFERVCLSV